MDEVNGMWSGVWSGVWSSEWCTRCGWWSFFNSPRAVLSLSYIPRPGRPTLSKPPFLCLSPCGPRHVTHTVPAARLQFVIRNAMVCKPTAWTNAQFDVIERANGRRESISIPRYTAHRCYGKYFSGESRLRSLDGPYLGTEAPRLRKGCDTWPINLPPETEQAIVLPHLTVYRFYLI